MKQGKLDDIIMKFCGDDDLRPAMMMPQYEPDNKLVIATNAHILIIAPDKYFDTQFEIEPRYPNWRATMPKENPIDDPLFILKTHDILAEIKMIPLENIYDACETCGGGGFHSCSCGNEHNCEPCNGTGEGRNIIGTELPHDTRFIINKIAYSCRFINLFTQVALRLGIDEIPVYSQGERTPLLTIFAGIKIMVMPFTEIDEDKIHITLETY